MIFPNFILDPKFTVDNKSQGVQFIQNGKWNKNWKQNGKLNRKKKIEKGENCNQFVQTE